MKINDLIKISNYLDPVTLFEFKNYLEENLVNICCKKDSTSKIIANNKDRFLYCEHCGCLLYRNGKTKSGIQKYICSGCKKTSSERTGTVSCGSNLSFEVWKNVIDNIINGFSIRRVAKENNISVDTSFRLRHKVLYALTSFIESIKLKGKVWADAQYYSLNFKGTKKDDMPRISKKRGSSSSLTGISHHKLCVIGAVDEYDNLILKIGGLGKGTTKMLENCFKDKVEEVSSFTVDSASAYMKFCESNNIELFNIPSGNYSNRGENLAEINNVHSQLSKWLTKFIGVSTKHFQNYLNWFTYLFIMLRKYEINELKLLNYKNIIMDKNHIKSKDICKIDMPINPKDAYAEYN